MALFRASVGNVKSNAEEWKDQQMSMAQSDINARGSKFE